MNLFWVLFLSLSLSTSSSSSLTPSCPMDLNYVLTVPWNTTDCHNPQGASKSLCCQTLLSLFGIAFAQHLKETSLFQLQDLPTSVSCLSDYQTKLNSLSLPSNLTSLCFDSLFCREEIMMLRLRPAKCLTDSECSGGHLL